MGSPTIDPLGQEVWRLAELFPRGATEDRKRLYLARLKRENVPADVLAEAVDRLEISLDTSNLPSLATVVGRCQDVLRERRGKEHRDNESATEALSSENGERAVEDNRALRRELSLVLKGMDEDNPFNLIKRITPAERAKLLRHSEDRKKRFGTPEDEVPF